MNDSRSRREWERGWKGHTDAQALRMAALTLAEKLDWLEEAHARVLRMQAQGGQVREGGGQVRGEPAKGNADADPRGGTDGPGSLG